MRRARTLIFLLLILIIGLAVAFFGIRALQQYLTPPPPPPVYVEIFVAGQNIPQGAVVTEDALTTISIPAEQVSAVEFTVDEKAQLITKVAKFPIDQGVVITSSMVAEFAQSVSIAGPQWAALISAWHDSSKHSGDQVGAGCLRHQRWRARQCECMLQSGGS